MRIGETLKQTGRSHCKVFIYAFYFGAGRRGRYRRMVRGCLIPVIRRLKALFPAPPCPFRGRQARPRGLRNGCGRPAGCGGIPSARKTLIGCGRASLSSTTGSATRRGWGPRKRASPSRGGSEMMRGCFVSICWSGSRATGGDRAGDAGAEGASRVGG